MENLLQEWKGNEGELQFMLKKTIDRNKSVIVDLEEACAKSDHEQIKFIAHKLKFIAKYFRLKALSTRIDAVEKAYDQNLIDTIIKQGHLLLEEINKSQKLLSSMIEKIAVSK